jgi:cysteine synthase A
MVQRTSGILASVLEAIGGTPLVALDRLTEGREGRILAKLEYLNPGASKKDRIARRIIEDAQRDGRLRPGQPVIELTSGSTGTGAAIVCSVLGIRFIAVMSAGNSIERARMMRALGAEVVLVPQSPDSLPGHVSGEDLALVETQTQHLMSTLDAFRIDQFNRPENALAHEEGTGAEIWEQSAGAVTAFCDFAGSGGSFAGITRSLTSRSPAIRSYIVEPTGAAVLSGSAVTSHGHAIQGGGYAMAGLPLLKNARIDGYLTVTDEEATEAARSLARHEGIFAGYSAGANVAAALKLLDGLERGGTIAVVICDSGLKYLSTGLYP